MKLYWKNIIWNHTVRYYLMWKYRNSEWKEFYTVKLVQTQKEMDECLHRVNILLKELSDEANQSL